VATDYDMSSGMHPPDHGRNALTLGFALLAGLGMILLIGAGTVGAINGEAADMDLINLLFAGGAALFITGVAAWAAVVRPWEHFDDIDVPAEGEHGHLHTEDHAEAH
jgi:hypothetical protein